MGSADAGIFCESEENCEGNEGVVEDEEEEDDDDDEFEKITADDEISEEAKELSLFLCANSLMRSSSVCGCGTCVSIYIRGIRK